MTLDPAYRYRATCVRVIDGDTYVLEVDLGFRCSVQFEGRLHGVDAPEVRGSAKAAGDAAAAYVAGLLLPGSGQPLLIESYRDERSFARWVVDVWLPDGSSLAQQLLDAGHAVAIDHA